MKKQILGILSLVGLLSADNIYSTQSSYYNNQVNSNNIDNSSWFSNNKVSLFGDFKRDYQAYMGGESLLYINGNYDMDSYMNRKEIVLQFGIYEKVYLMYGKGKYSQKGGIDEYDAEDTGYYKEGAKVDGDYTVTGLSYHFVADSEDTVAMEWYESKFNKVTNTAYESEYYPYFGSKYEKDSIDKSELDNSTLMLRYSHYLKGGHTGWSLGTGIDKSGLIISFGISLRYF